MDPFTIASTGLQLAGGIKNLLSDSGMSPRKQYVQWQNSLRTELPLRVEGAKAAGLHPLVAVGASPASGFSPHISVGSSKGDDLISLGQNISRAASAYDSKSQRVVNDTAEKLALERAGLQNELLRSQISAINRSGATPGINPGSMSGDVIFNPDENTRSTGYNNAFTAGSNAAKPAVTTFRNRDGSTSTYPSQDAKQSIEDSLIYEADHFYRNRIAPWFQRRVDELREGARRSIWNPDNYR